jgi:hypothetical protein
MSVPQWSLIPFQDVKTAMGIAHIDASKTSGKFTCERSGVYLIAAFVQSNTHENGFTIYKNNKALGDAQFIGKLVIPPNYRLHRRWRFNEGALYYYSSISIENKKKFS